MLPTTTFFLAQQSTQEASYMKHLSLSLLAETVVSRRKALKLSQTALSQKANMNRSILSRLETQDYSPSVDQLLSLCSVLDFQH
jgi:UDPglucose 6-dehydrogenase